jgi:hypothetical protein
MELENLPDDSLLEIFKRISRHQDLLSLILTCKRFEFLVSTSPLLMRKIPISVNFNDLKCPLTIFESQRKYQKIIIKNASDENFQFLFDFFTFYANYITHVKFVRGNFSVDKFMDLLNVFKELKVLELDQVFFNGPTIESGIKNVRALKIYSCSRDIFSTVIFKDLVEFEANYTPLQIQHWDSFLKCNSDLKKLVIRCTFGIDLSDECINFVTKNLSALEHFEILDKYVKVNNEIYKIICQNCSNLKYLKLWNINIEKEFNEIDKNYLRSKGINCELYNDISLSGSGNCFQIM